VSADLLFEKLSAIDVDNPLCSYTRERCERLAPIIDEINALKLEKRALILAHSYVHPDIIYGVADHVGDSYGLAKKAMETKCDIILFPSVRFMAETAKLLNPKKIVIDPNPNGGCSLADSITADQVKLLRLAHPDHTFICYINTTAAVKAECDICVTSSNVNRIVETLPTDKIFFLPDKLMGLNLRRYLSEKGIKKEMLLHDGTCYVHEEFSADEVERMRNQHAGLKVLAHPECKEEVTKLADMVGSTTQITDYVENQPNEGPFLILTECGITSRLQVEHPQAKMVGSCMLCKYMKSNSLEAILHALKNPTDEMVIKLDPAVEERARACVRRMFEI